MRSALLALAVLALALPSAAGAADATSPQDGATVPSRPTFAYDFTNGVGEVELSRSPDVLTAGDNVGGFVDVAASDYAVLYSREPRDGLAPFSRRLDSGLYYWHVRTRNDDNENAAFTVWGPTRTLTVEADPIAYEGWTLRAQRLKRRGKCSRLRLRGTVSYNDNDPRPSVTGTLTVRAGGRVVARGRWKPTYSPAQFDGVFCVKPRRFTVTVAVTDRDDYRAESPRRSVSA